MGNSQKKMTITHQVGDAVGRPWDAKQRLDPWFLDRHNQFVQNTRNNSHNVHVLFYGGSLTEGWESTGREPFDQYYAPLGTANYGIAGDQTQHLNWRIFNREVEGLNPKLIVLQTGTNNLSINDNDIATGILSVVTNLCSKMPNAKLLLLGVLPRSTAKCNGRVRNINSQIMSVDNGKSVRYFDMYDTFCKGDDQFECHLYDPDLLHLSTAGYWAWAEAMAPIFNEMLNS